MANNNMDGTDSLLGVNLYETMFVKAKWIVDNC